MRTFVFWMLLASLALAQPSRLVLCNAVVHTAVGPAFQGYVVIEGDRIAAVGSGSPPAGEVVDLGGKDLYPGLIDVDSCLGLAGVESQRAELDQREVGDLNPDLVARYAYRAESPLISVARSQGILYSGVNPRGGLVCGQGSVMRTWGWSWEDMTVKPTWALAVDFPSLSVDPTDKKSERDEAYAAIGGKIFLLNEAWAQADRYRENGVRDLKWGALHPYVEGQAPVMVRVQNEDEAKRALEWTEQHHLKVVLAAGGALENVAQTLSERQIPVIYSTVFNANPDEVEGYDLFHRMPGMLAAKGITVALSPNGLAFDARELRDVAGRARIYGLTDVEALQMITLNPAKILGVDKELGSIEVGKKASLVLCDGDILEVPPRVMRAWGEGKEIDLDDPQKQLYQKYRRHLQQMRGQE